VKTQLEHLFRHPGIPGKAVKDPAPAGAAALAQERHNRLVGLAGMNDQGFVPRQRPVQKEAQILALDLFGGIVVIEIESDLAEGDHPGVLQQSRDLVEILRTGLGDIVGVDPHRRKDHGILFRQLHAPAAGGEVDADGDDLPHPVHLSAVKHLLAVGVELVEIEMGVGVDKPGAHFTFAPASISPCGERIAIRPWLSSAASSMPLDSIPRITAGCRLATMMMFIPTSASGA